MLKKNKVLYDVGGENAMSLNGNLFSAVSVGATLLMVGPNIV